MAVVTACSQSLRAYQVSGARVVRGWHQVHDRVALAERARQRLRSSGSHTARRRRQQRFVDKSARVRARANRARAANASQQCSRFFFSSPFSFVLNESCLGNGSTVVHVRARSKRLFDDFVSHGINKWLDMHHDRSIYCYFVVFLLCSGFNGFFCCVADKRF